MKILLCHNRYLQRGGEDQVFDDERKLLKSAGFEVIEYVTTSQGLEGKNSLEVAKLTIWNSKTYREVRSLIRDSKPALMHCTNTFPVLSPSIYAAAKRERVPIVQSLHNFRSVCAGSLLLRNGESCEKCVGKLIPLSGVMHRCYRGSVAASAVLSVVIGMENVRRKFSQHIDRYIALSNHARDILIRAGFPASRVSVKSNFISGSHTMGNGTPGQFLFVGRLADEKGLHVLLECWSRLPQHFKLTIAGDGPLAPLVRAAAKTHSNIRYVGLLNGEQVLAELRSAFSLIVPSLCYEMCPKVILEAYASGTPVIASDHGALREYVVNGRTGTLFAPGDAEDLRNKIFEWTNANENMEELRRATRLHFEENFTPRRNLEQLARIYRSVLQERNLATTDLEALFPSQELLFR